MGCFYVFIGVIIDEIGIFIDGIEIIVEFNVEEFKWIVKGGMVVDIMKGGSGWFLIYDIVEKDWIVYLWKCF